MPARRTDPVKMAAFPRPLVNIPNVDMGSQARSPMPTSICTQDSAPLPAPQQMLIPQPAADVPPPTVNIGTIHSVMPVTDAPVSVVSAPVKQFMSTILTAAPTNWLQQVPMGPNPCFRIQPVFPSVLCRPAYLHSCLH